MKLSQNLFDLLETFPTNSFPQTDKHPPQPSQKHRPLWSDQRVKKWKICRVILQIHTFYIRTSLSLRLVDR